MESQDQADLQVSHQNTPWANLLKDSQGHKLRPQTILMVSALALNHCWPPRNSSGFRNQTDSDWSWILVPNSQTESGRAVLSSRYFFFKYLWHAWVYFSAGTQSQAGFMLCRIGAVPNPGVWTMEHVQRVLSTSSEVNGWSILKSSPWPKTKESQSPVPVIRPSPSSLCQALSPGVIFSLKQLERLHLNKPSAWVLFNLWDWGGFFLYVLWL